MTIGAILQASSFGYAQMVVARIVTGLGNGLNVGLNNLTIEHCWLMGFTDFNCTFVPRRMFSSCEAWCLDYDRGKFDYVRYHGFVSDASFPFVYEWNTDFMVQICKLYFGSTNGATTDRISSPN